MKLEQVKLIDLEVRTKYLLPVALMSSDFEEVVVDQALLREFNLFSSNEVRCFTFVINGAERHYVFYCEVAGHVRFTRAKEGLVEELIKTINPRDFQYDLFDTPLNNRFNVCGKIVVGYINNYARNDISNAVVTYAQREHEYTIGYNVTSHYRYALTYDADFVLHVKGVEGKYLEYRGTFIRGKFNNITDVATGQPTGLFNIFNQ